MTNRQQCPSADDLRRLFNGTLAPDDAERVVTHLDQCQQCCDSVAQSEKKLAESKNLDQPKGLLENLRSIKGIDRDVLENTFDTPAESSALASRVLRDATAFDNSENLSPDLPSEIGEYRIVRQIGRGGMGIVYQAEHASLKRTVALKVLPPELSRRMRSVERFRREAIAAASLHHTNIVPVFEVDHVGDQWFYAMQLIDGCGLDVLRREIKSIRTSGIKDITKGDETDTIQSRVNQAGEQSQLSTRDSHETRSNQSLDQDFMEQAPFDDDLLATHIDQGVEADVADSDIQLQVLNAISKLVANIDTAAGAKSATRPKASIGSNQYATIRQQKQFRNALAYSASDRISHYALVAEIGRQVSGALHHAHQRGIIHRDVKPSNLILDHNGNVWLADFGLAKQLGDGGKRTVVI